MAESSTGYHEPYEMQWHVPRLDLLVLVVEEDRLQVLVGAGLDPLLVPVEVELYVTETFTFRVLEPAAAIHLQNGA